MLIDETFTIGEIAEIFHVPSSTIRYWEEKQLIAAKRNTENGYRVFDFQTILDLTDIVFYRDLNVPVKQMIHFHQNPPEKLLELLNETEEKTLEQLEELERKRDGIRKRKKQFNDLLALKNQDFILDSPDIEKMIPFDLKDPAELQIYMENPGNSAAYYRPNETKTIDFALIVPADYFTQEETLWSNADSHHYYKFLMLIQSDDPTKTNLFAKKVELEGKNLTTGQVLGRYLATAIDEAGIQMDYYKAWIEVLPEA